MATKKEKSEKKTLPTITIMGIEFDFSKYSTWFIIIALMVSILMALDVIKI